MWKHYILFQTTWPSMSDYRLTVIISFSVAAAFVIRRVQSGGGFGSTKRLPLCLVCGTCVFLFIFFQCILLQATTLHSGWRNRHSGLHPCRDSTDSRKVFCDAIFFLLLLPWRNSLSSIFFHLVSPTYCYLYNQHAKITPVVFTTYC